MKIESIYLVLGLFGAAFAGAEPVSLFREDWAETPFALPVTQEHVANLELKLNLYGGAVEYLKKSHHDTIAGDPYYVWSGEIKSTDIWAATLGFQDGSAVDLSGSAQLTWRTRQSGGHCLHILLRTLGGGWLVSEPVVCESADWQITTHVFSHLSWKSLEADGIDFSKAVEVENPDLSRIVEIGFTDMRAGQGSPYSSRVDWLEAKGNPRPEVIPHASLLASDQPYSETMGYSMDGNMGTRWFAEGPGHWLGVEFVNESSVEVVDIAWWKNRERFTEFEIQASLDGIEWETVLPQTATRGMARDFESYVLPHQVDAKFLRIVGYGNNLNAWTAVCEWRALGKAGAPAWFEAYSETNGWRNIPWLGYVHTEADPWVGHSGMGWLFTVPQEDSQFLLWDARLGWIWTTRDYFPYLYIWEKDGWYKWLEGIASRRFLNLQSMTAEVFQ